MVKAVMRADLTRLLKTRDYWIPLVILGGLFFVVLPALLLGSMSIIDQRSTMVSQIGDIVGTLPDSIQRNIEGDSPTTRASYAFAVYLLAPIAIVVPLTISSAVGANSIVGERERGTGEFLAHSPLTVREIYLGRRIDFPEGIATVEGWDPRAEVPKNRMIRSEDGYIIETISDYINREPRWTIKYLLQSFWDDETEWTGFRWWWDNYALQGKVGVFMWNPGAVGSDFERDGLFGVPIVSGSPTLETSVDRGYRGVGFSIRGRYDG
jgi:hypothetical protein